MNAITSLQISITDVKQKEKTKVYHNHKFMTNHQICNKPFRDKQTEESKSVMPEEDHRR